MSHILSGKFSPKLTAACNALGRYDPESKIYFYEDSLVETVKDIIRYLRRDSKNYDNRRYFGNAKIFQINLIPLLKLHWEQTDLFDVLLRLMGNLTNPVLLLFNEEVPKDKEVRSYFQEILDHQQSYKEAFADENLWAALVTRLRQLLETQDRGTEDGLIIERILILVRNVLSVPATVNDEKRADNDVSAHDKVLWTLRQSGFLALLHYMASKDEEESYSMYLLEILSLMLRDYRALDLAQVFSEAEKSVDEKMEFEKIRKREMDARKDRRKKYIGDRHSRFGGTFHLKNIKSVNGEQDLIYHKKLNAAATLDFDVDKSTAKIANNRQPIRETDSHRRSTSSVRLLLKDFCIEFLNSGYNKLMHTVRGKLVRGTSMEHEETYYLWALRFFMEFNRQYEFNVKLVSETMGHEMFYYMQQRMEHHFTMIVSNTTKWPLWSKRLHLSVLAYKELLLNIAKMDKSTDSTIREHAKVVKSNIFYVMEYLEFILQLLSVYEEQKMSNVYLLDLLETNHIFLKMLEEYCGEKIILVKKKKKQHTDDEDGAMKVETEVEFKFQDFVNRYVQPEVVQTCGLALRQYDTNSLYANHCILKLLHRIAWDCKMPAMLFQASIFRTFQRIFDEEDRPELKELQKFATYIVRQFIKVSEKNKKVFLELLFWKDSKDAHDIEEGYGSYEKSEAMKKSWTEKRKKMNCEKSEQQNQGVSKEKMNFNHFVQILIDEDIIDSDSSSSDEENEDRGNIRENATSHAKDNKSKRSTSKMSIINQKFELPVIKKLILEIIEIDAKESLKWISECLTEAAEYQEQDMNLDGNEGIPLVPINAKDIQAIKNPVFIKFLLGIGIQKPASEQETFWRIPGNILAAELTNQANFIDEIIENVADAYPEYNDQPVVGQPAEGSSDVRRNFIPKSLTAKKSKKRITVVDDSNEHEVNVSKKKTEIISLLDDSDESEPEIVLQNNTVNDTNKNENKVSKSITKKKSKKIQPLDSDESDTEIVEDNIIEKQITTKISKIILIESSESDSERMEDSDSESNDYSVKRKKLSVIESDEDK